MPFSSAAADPTINPVPPECAELYANNGAVPNTASCTYLASTISVGLGNYYCRTFASDYVDDYCGDTQSKEWANLDGIRKKYEFEDSIDSNEAGFAHQFYCIADKSCSNYETSGDQSWAKGFVKHLFDTMITEGELPNSLTLECWGWMNNDACFKFKGYRAHTFELIAGFYSYCSLARTNVDYDQWDEDHNTFLQSGVTACLNQVEAADNLDDIWELPIVLSAKILREDAQLACLVQNFIRSGGNVIGSSSIFARSVSSEVDVVVPNSLRLPTPDKADFFDTFWQTVGTLRVSISDDTFFVRPGEQAVVSVSRITADGGTVPIEDSEGVVLEIITNEQHANISDSGVLTVTSAASPFSIGSNASVILVVASVGEERGVGQVMIVDVDTDGDTLVDSYEDSAGFNKAVPNDLQADSDNDGTTDLEQIIEDARVIAIQGNDLIDSAPTSVVQLGSTDDSGGSSLDQSDESTSNRHGSGSISLWLLCILGLNRNFFIRRDARRVSSVG